MTQLNFSNELYLSTGTSTSHLSNVTMLSATSLLHNSMIFNRNNTVATQQGMKTYWLWWIDSLISTKSTQNIFSFSFRHFANQSQSVVSLNDLPSAVHNGTRTNYEHNRHSQSSPACEKFKWRQNGSVHGTIRLGQRANLCPTDVKSNSEHAISIGYISDDKSTPNECKHEFRRRRDGSQ